jgi:starch synthase
MRILFASTEAVPFSKTGGLGDVCGSLPPALAQFQHEPTLVLPAFRSCLQAGQPLEELDVALEIPIGRKSVVGSVLQSRLADCHVRVLLIRQDHYYDRPQLYGENGKDYEDNSERFIFFCRAVLEVIELLDLAPDVLHCHDWQTGLVPAYLRTEYAALPAFERIATLFTIHNLAYQGNFWHWDMELTGIGWEHFNWREMEFHGKLSFMKTAIAFADQISTVSARYAQEIQSPPLSCGMEGILQHRSGDLTGIVNGVNYNHWDPASDPHLQGKHYTSDTFEEKKPHCKRALQQELRLPVEGNTPLVGIVGRLVDQKGWDLISEVMEDSVRTSPAQWAVLGTGEPKYHKFLVEMTKKHPDKVAVSLDFSDPLAHRIEAGADIFLMPSQFEPCGLNQLYSLRYGTVPVVRATGGLADTIVNATPETLAAGTANGFSFESYSAAALAKTLQRAILAYADRPVWRQLVKTGMQQDWSWRRSARQYSDLYAATVAKHRQTHAMGCITAAS